MNRFLAILPLLLLVRPSASARFVAPNDEFVTRTLLTGQLPLSWSGYAGNLTSDLADAHIDSGEDLDECELHGTLWFEWSAPEAGIYDFRGREPFTVAVLKAPPPDHPQIPSFDQRIEKDRASTGVLIRASAGQRFWITLAEEGDPVPDNLTSLQISHIAPAPPSKESAAPLPSTPSVPIQQVIEKEGWWRWRAPSAGAWRARRDPSFYKTEITILRADGSIASDLFHHFKVSADEELYIHSTTSALAWTDLVLEPFAPSLNLSPQTAHPLLPNDTGASYAIDPLPEYSQSLEGLKAWFSWVAPRDGIVGFLPWIPGPLLSVYRDDNGTLTSVGPHTPVTAGSRYLMSLPFYPMEIRVDYLTARGSDSFAGAPDYDVARSQDYFADATTEPGEPGLLFPGERTRWWTFTPAVGGTAYLSGDRVNVYSGDSIGTLTPVISLLHPAPSPVVSLQGGIRYHIQVFDSTIVVREGLTHFGLMFRGNSPHDHFADAAPVTLAPYHSGPGARISLTGTTAEPGEPPATPGIPAARTAWLRWTAGFTGRVMMSSSAWYSPSIVPPGELPALAVWKGNSLASLERVPTNPFHDGHGFANPAFDAAAGNTYSFQVEATPGSTDYQLFLIQVPTDVDACDSFAAPQSADLLATSNYTHYRMFRRATFEPGESTEGIPAAPPGYTSGSYWVSWTAPHTGIWRIWVPWRWYGRIFTLYSGSLTAGRLAVMSPSAPGPLYVRLNVGDTLYTGNIVYQSNQENAFPFIPLHPEITPAVPGIALAEWYHLPSPANLNAAYSPDGIPLLLKHALGLDPLRNSLPGGDDPSTSRWPRPFLQPSGELSLSFRAAAPFQAGNGVDLNGEFSRDLLTWLPAPEAGNAGLRTVSVPANEPLGFLRLKASLR